MIIITGADGYLGWPTLLKASKEFPGEDIIGVDNFDRRKWVTEIGSVSAIPIASTAERLSVAKEYGFHNISFIEGDLKDNNFVRKLLKVFRPRAILHMAAQPSAPYSQINSDTALFTAINNNGSNLNLLWAIKESNLETHFIETTTTGVYGAPEIPIPEGFVEVVSGNQKDLLPYPGMAGSWYHMSKANDVNHLWLAHQLWQLTISDLRTSIVYGTRTAETALDPRLATRFDFDFYFGVVANRFCAQVVIEQPLTVYGAGNQLKPMISLEDAVASHINVLKLSPHNTFKVYNQLTSTESITDLANTIVKAAEQLGVKSAVNHIENPRVEKEEHFMEIDTTNFRSELLPQININLQKGVTEILMDLMPHKSTLLAYKNRFLAPS